MRSLAEWTRAPPGGRGERGGAAGCALSAARGPESEFRAPGGEQRGAAMLRARPPAGDLPRAGEVLTGVMSLGVGLAEGGAGGAPGELEAPRSEAGTNLGEKAARSPQCPSPRREHAAFLFRGGS